MRRVALVVLGMVLIACGEPSAGFQVPERAEDQRVLDLAGVLDEHEVGAALASIEGADVVALTVELADPNLGAADRAGRRLLEEWDADIALVAVAEPGDFTSGAEGRQRVFGIVASDVRSVGRGLREQIVEEIVPPLAADNDWTAAFAAAVQRLAGP